MPNLGPTELFLILIVVIILFGPGRIGRLGKELGTGIREFRRGMSEGNEKDKEEEAQTVE
jgi:sec-independent protein translocase protein TatA